MAPQIFVSFPELGLPTRAVTLTLTPGLTLLHLKLFLRLAAAPLYFSFGGKLHPDSTPLAALPPSAVLALRPRLLGGGGDGGATGAESRDCYLNMYAIKKPDKVDPNETRLSKWTTCALCAEPLAPPCVLDHLGNVFNKEPLVEALIHRKLPKEFKHIRGLKDMIPLHFTPIPSPVDTETKFHCPITGLEFNGKYGFLTIKGCGHVLSSKALKEVKTSACLVCHKEFSESDKIVINGNKEEVMALREKMEEERGRVKEKKDRKSLSGTKHRGDEKIGGLENGGKEGRKRLRAVDMAPANATKEVYASIFTSSKKSEFKETYSCRSLPLGRN